MDRLSAATSAEEFAAVLGSMDDDARLSTASDCLRAALAANWTGLDPASLPKPSPWLDEEARRGLSLERGAESTETSESADTQRKKRITAGANRIAIGARATHLLYAAACLLRLAVVEEDLVSAGASGEGEEGTANESPPSLLLSFRTLLAWQRLLVEPAIQIKEAMENVLSLLEALPPGTLSRDEAIALALERVYAHLAHDDHERARESLDAARALANLRLELTGRMGKRTRHQVKELAQLVLDTGRDSDAETSSTGEGIEEKETRMEIESDDTAKDDGEDEGVDLDVPVNCRNEDDTLLQKVTLSAGDSSSSSRPLSSLDLAIVLASCQLEQFFEAEELLLEQCAADLEEVIGRRRCWSVQASALLIRSKLELRQKRHVERAARQAEALAFAVMGVEGSRVSSEVSLARTRLILASGLPPYWRVREVHAEILVSLGWSEEEIRVYERPESWEGVVDCYGRKGQRDAASVPALLEALSLEVTLPSEDDLRALSSPLSPLSLYLAIQALAGCFKDSTDPIVKESALKAMHSFKRDYFERTGVLYHHKQPGPLTDRFRLPLVELPKPKTGKELKKDKKEKKEPKAAAAAPDVDIKPVKAGEKKDVSGDMPSAYNPRYVESVWYSWWEKQGFFKPEFGGRVLTKPNPKGTFTLCIPPPNVTGTLHVGHALAASVEDTVTRWQRMRGVTTLFNPGTDHAGIATQVVVEKRLQRERGLSRHDLGREAFIEEVWRWVHEKGDVIYNQFRDMGASVDWDRAVFMMDPTVIHPFVSRELPIIADAFVDREFGTGAVKITPAHDHTDYEVGVRHSLPFVSCITDEGNISEGCGKFSGMKRFDARAAVSVELETLGLYRGKKDNAMVVPVCKCRSKDIIEPILKAQWYVACDKMAVDAVKNGDLKIIPDTHIATWNRWLENSREWCISRQLWWGHRIPAYFITVNDGGKTPRGDPADNKYWVSAHSEADALKKAAAKFGVEEELISLKWDEDVLDTWFSSGMWPFVIFGWPEKTNDFATFFPGALLETGHDILFFWVARMVFMALELTGEIPFKEVFLHAMIRDAHGRKMSKSLGNVIDPRDVIKGVTLAELQRQLETGNLDAEELATAKSGQARDYPNGIPECGTDALRFALMAYTRQGKDINLDVLRVQGYRFFCNKIWQAVRFTLMQLGKEFKPAAEFKVPSSATPIDRWILSRLSATVAVCNAGFAAYNFAQVTSAIYDFWLYDFCDVYLESVKPVISGGDADAIAAAREVLLTCATEALCLLSPLMPFVSEELWQRLPRRSSQKSPSIVVAEYPETEKWSLREEALEADVASAMAVVKTVRSLRSDYDLQFKTKTDLLISCSSPSEKEALAKLAANIGTLASSDKVAVFTSTEADCLAPAGSAQMTISATTKVFIALQGVVDTAKERVRLAGKKAKLEAAMSKIAELQASKDYENKAPVGVRTAYEEKRTGLKLELRSLDAAIAALS